MTYLSLTYFRLRNSHPVGMALFFLHTWRSSVQAERSPGFLGGRLTAGPGHLYVTLTRWESEEAMRGYRKAGAHRAAMRGMAVLGRYCSEAATHGQWYDGPEPDLDTLVAALNAEGRFLNLPNPTAAHRERCLVPSLYPGSRPLVPRGPKVGSSLPGAKPPQAGAGGWGSVRR